MLWARSATTGVLTFTWGLPLGATSQITYAVADPLQPVTTTLTGLTANSRYIYTVTSPTGEAASGSFRTLAPLGEKVGLRFGVSGDWRGELAPYPALSNAPARGLDFFVELGDTIYADFVSPCECQLTQSRTLVDFRLKHGEVYSTHAGLNTLAALRANMPIYATLDDHEVTNDVAGGALASSDARFGGSGLVNDAPLFETALQVFQDSTRCRANSTAWWVAMDAWTMSANSTVTVPLAARPR